MIRLIDPFYSKFWRFVFTGKTQSVKCPSSQIGDLQMSLESLSENTNKEVKWLSTDF